MNKMEKPNFSFNSSIFNIISFSITTSNAVVGSSIIIKFGLSANAIAITTLCLIPPESSCG